VALLVAALILSDAVTGQAIPKWHYEPNLVGDTYTASLVCDGY